MRFAYQLATRLGILHVERDILRGLTYKEFCGWMNYAALDPFTELRADYRTAHIVKMLYDANRGKKSKALRIEDFLLDFKTKPRRKQTWQDQLAILKIVGMSAALATKVGEAK